jgi:hypothetical protein
VLGVRIESKTALKLAGNVEAELKSEILTALKGKTVKLN